MWATFPTSFSASYFGMSGTSYTIIWLVDFNPPTTHHHPFLHKPINGTQAETPKRCLRATNAPFHRHIHYPHGLMSSLLHLTKLHQVDSKPEARINLHGPAKLGKQRLVEYFLNGHVMTLAPSHGYTRIHVVNL